MSVRLQTPNISQAGTWPCQECHYMDSTQTVCVSTLLSLGLQEVRPASLSRLLLCLDADV